MAFNVQIRPPKKRHPHIHLMKVVVDGVEHYEDGPTCAGDPKTCATKGHKTCLPAQQWKLDKLKAHDAGLQVQQKDVTLRALWPVWMSHLQSRRGKDSKRGTPRAYQQRGDNHILPGLGDLKLRGVTEQMIIDWQNKLLITPSGRATKGLSRSFVAAISRTLKQCLDHGVKLRYIPSNPMTKDARIAGVSTTGNRQTMLPPPGATDAALLRFREKNLNEWFIATLLSQQCGTRIGETLAVRWCDVDWGSDRSNSIADRKPSILIPYTAEDGSEEEGGLRMVLPKSNKERRVSLPNKVVRALKEWRELQQQEAAQVGREIPADGLIVCNSLTGAACKPSPFGKKFKRNSGFNFHRLRHEHASYLIVIKKLDVKAVCERLGHSSPAITMNTYLWLFNMHGADAALDALNEDDDGVEANLTINLKRAEGVH